VKNGVHHSKPMSGLESQLKQLSYAQLLVARQEINNLLIAKRSQNLKDLRSKLTAIAKDSGFNLDEVMSRTRRPFGAVTPDKRVARVRYQHPDKPEYQWTGKGKTPNWLLSAMREKNRPRDYFKVS
jgi:DNA-binding protein H-NS